MRLLAQIDRDFTLFPERRTTSHLKELQLDFIKFECLITRRARSRIATSTKLLPQELDQFHACLSNIDVQLAVCFVTNKAPN